MSLRLRITGRKPMEPTPAATSRWRLSGIAIPLWDTFLTQRTSEAGGDQPPGESARVDNPAACGLEGAADQLLEPLDGKRPDGGGRAKLVAEDGRSEGDESYSGKEKRDIAPGARRCDGVGLERSTILLTGEGIRDKTNVGF